MVSVSGCAIARMPGVLLGGGSEPEGESHADTINTSAIPKQTAIRFSKMITAVKGGDWTSRAFYRQSTPPLAVIIEKGRTIASPVSVLMSRM